MRFLLSLLTILPIAAWAQASQPPGQNGSGSELRNFVQRAAQFDMVQAHLGKLAEQKAASQQVKDYGTKLVNSHTEAYNHLGQFAATTPFTVPKAIDAQHQAVVRRFDNLSGAQFDRAFQQQQIQSHRDMLNWLQQEQNSSDEQVKQQASSMLPEVQRHLQEAQALGNQNASSGNNPASGDANSNRAATANTSGGAQHNGTVTKYEPGKLLEVKVRDRIGRHRYNLSAMSAQVPADLKTGDTVTVSENIDSNGTRSLTVERTAGAQHSGQASRSNTQQP